MAAMSITVALCLAVSVLMIAQPVALLATDMTLKSGLSRAGKVRSSWCLHSEQAYMIVIVSTAAQAGRSRGLMVSKLWDAGNMPPASCKLHEGSMLSCSGLLRHLLGV